ncbi:FAD-dependent monooxygenase [Enterovirga rhinocerotis]|uniref:2-polyprenyl-6-methoxyphenol hydroxylase-like FAD-dependent oxidoreductase n=1 Tax=Enterovirga rhinocerotis TaxID=1339210 RepID=A0A4R7C8I4_9HYPH|nr:FAD-dependent monooxygenase [Enterovirga rhinocerotis]TDR94954.1 2-polyprenyl-6-methoxyphenol hydroxylase-like FAD-dependent oxidoreductase [Enterovirga rhinocerotis]
MPTVLVAGAGPVGLTMAAELARYGIAVRIIDASPHQTETSKALVLWSRTLELMDRMGCTAPFLDAGLRARGAAIRSDGALLGTPRFDAIASAYNYALMIPQRDTERLLTDHLRSLGVEIEREVELTGFTARETGVEATLRHVDGREEVVQADWLIGCDGAHSTVRHGLGATFAGSAQGDDWLLADIRIEGPKAPPSDELSIHFHPDGPFVVFPLPGGRARVVAPVGKSDPSRPRDAPTLAEVQALADARAGGGFRLTDPVWLSNFRINERKVADYRYGRVFLAGDAAHIHSPAGGQGMNTGMQDAINLAWKLAMVVRGSADPVLLDSYSAERSAVGDMVLRNATRLTAAATLSRPAARFLRDAVMRFLLGFKAVRAGMVSTMSEINIAYPNSPLSHGSGGGTRWDPRHDRGAPPGSGREPRFVLYTDDAARGAGLAARFPSLLEAEPRKPVVPGTLVIVRPDGYVGLSGSASDWGSAESYLGRLASAG